MTFNVSFSSPIRGENICTSDTSVESFPVKPTANNPSNVAAHGGQQKASHLQPPHSDIVNSSSRTQQSDPDKLEEEEDLGPRGGALLPSSWAPECTGGVCVVAEQEFEQGGGAGASVGPLRRASTSPSWGPEPDLVEEEEEAERESSTCLDRSASEVTLSENQEEEEEVEKISARMNTFRKEERKPSLFTRAIERLSFR